MLVVLFMPLQAQAATQDTRIYVRPHCEGEFENEVSLFGEVPDYGGLNLFEERCSNFSVENPQTLMTPKLLVGEELNIDIVVRNTSGQAVNHVRSWLSYDPNVLEGVSVDVHANFPAVTPGESNFDTTNGYVMVEASNDASDANKQLFVRVAQVKLKVKQAPPSGTFISFYDVQRGGHTTVDTTENSADENILGEEPGGLHVVLDAGEGDRTDTTGTADTSDDTESNGGAATPNPGTAGGPAPTPAFGAPPLPNGGGDTSGENPFANQDNAFGTSGEGLTANTSDQGTPDRTAFSLLQVRNVRTTTEGTSIYLAWDQLNSSTLKAYNVYYGTTTGRYIQRKTVDKEMKSVILRSLPIDAKYFMAVRAVSIADEESAFSQEVAIVVGDPSSSTALLIEGDPGSDIVTSPVSGSVNGQIPGGETGVPSSLALFLLISAILGTLLASRRQLIVSSTR
ncbi:MAG: hypothetical protein O2904_00250 [bacterium]|nr:hypothetical protein [bacterium]